jgi:predicted ribosomally synthesized peptide with SipW-like signal peptide
MKKWRNLKMNKKALLSLILVGALSLGAAGSYAWFTSNAQGTVSHIKAGTIDVGVNGPNKTFTMDIKTNKLVQPGDILTTGQGGYTTIIVKNNGTLPLASFGRFTLADDTGLGDDMKITDYKVEFFDAQSNEKRATDNFIVNNVKSNSGFASNMRGWVDGSGPLDIMGTPWDIEGLKPQEYYKITFRLEYDTAATDQGKECKLGFEVKTTQVNNDALANLHLDGVTDGALTSWYGYLSDQTK